ncbi:hypothetical protein HMPREF2996_00180 [Corynebacterium sp. HMSC066C02]|uniref:hypothetical protein n=1 Tax=Corynebacterium sp. HMSC066C02 TaxID=1739500 RepID=UPI0008A3D9A6|nr:hypothetical protein [Corynebacterium sp. HMSC066C02]OFP19927.1 hypothetical protein HMPREF2996_00180 [Corynebacterium sp. HMSC066C02]
MGIRPNNGDKAETNYRVDGSTEAQQLINDAEHTGNEAGKVFAEISAQADSANNGMSELSKRVTALEQLNNLPLILFWDGKSTKPPLQPKWRLFNGSTGQIEKG